MNEVIIKQQVGARIKKFRQLNKLTQFKLGELIDINQRQIALIESGKSYPSLQPLPQLAEVFDCSLPDLFEDNSLITESHLKEQLKSMIDKTDFENCKRLYIVMKNFINL